MMPISGEDFIPKNTVHQNGCDRDAQCLVILQNLIYSAYLSAYLLYCLAVRKSQMRSR